MGHPESPATLPLLPRLFYVARRKKDFGRDQPTLASPLLSGTALLFFFFFFLLRERKAAVAAEGAAVTLSPPHIHQRSTR